MHIQTLEGFIALCPWCHKTKHAGLATLNDEFHIVLRQLMKVNKWTELEVHHYMKVVTEQWVERNKYEWKLDVSYLEDY